MQLIIVIDLILLTVFLNQTFLSLQDTAVSPAELKHQQ